MKNFWKENKTGLLTVAILLISLFFTLGVEPGAALTKTTYGWLLVRGGVLVFAAAVGMLTYGKYEKLIINKNSMKWTIWWVIATQIMTSFWIAEWCVGGF